MAKPQLKTVQRASSWGRYAGKWVALVENEVIAWSDSLKELVEKVERSGLAEKPVYFLVPRKDEGPYVLFSQKEA